jgi:hypothetical protein
MKLGVPNSEAIARMPWFVRLLMGCCMASAE